MKLRILLSTLVLSFVLLSAQALAVSITPSSQFANYASGETGTASFIVSDGGNVNITLASSTIPNTRLITPASMGDCRSGCTVQVEYTLPNLDDRPGNHDIAIEARDLPLGGVGMVAYPLIKGYVKFKVPYPGKFVEAQVSSPLSEYTLGTSVPITVTARAAGGEAVDGIGGHLTIYSFSADSLNENFTIPLGDFGRIEPDTTSDVTATWNTAGVEPGRYRIATALNYDSAEGERTARAEIYQTTIGQKLVKIHTVGPSELAVGQIQRVIAAIESFWNEELSAHVNLRLKDSSGLVIAEDDTETVDINMGRRTPVEGFLDLRDAVPGSYTLVATSKFGEDLEDMEEFPFTLVPAIPNAEATNFAGQATSSGGSGNGGSYLVYVAIGSGVVAVIALALVLVMFLKRRNGGGNGSGGSSAASSEEDEF